MSDDDGKLVRAARKGDRQAFDRLVERYQRMVVAVAGRLLSNIDDGLEVAQEAFVRAYQSLGQLKEPERFGPWLMRITTNQALNYRRARSRRGSIMTSLAGKNDDREATDGLEQLAGKEAAPVEEASAGELAGSLEEAIEGLPENLRAPLLLFAVGKLPQKEVAEMLGCSVQTVKWSVFEARRRLRESLAEYL